ncbi:MAG: lactonase family protein [Rhodocyclaceae bacterium]
MAKILRAWAGLPAMLALSTLLGGCASTGSQTASASACTPAGLALVGSDGNQIHALRFDACAGKMTSLGPVADVPKPKWLAPHPQLPLVYAATDGTGQEGSVAAFSLDRESGGLTKVGERAAGGAGTTYVALDQSSATLFAANFGGGSASSIALNADGSLGTLVSTIKATGSGPHRRQTSPHAHGIALDPTGHYALVPDLGADRVFIYSFDRASHRLSPDDAASPHAFATPPGSGPRRAVFDADGRFVYVVNELSAEIMTLKWDAATARLSPVQSQSISTPDFKGAKSASEIALSHDGRFVYVGDRGENTLVVYRVNDETGELTLNQRLPSGGDAPWAFEMHASGKWLLVANYRSNRVNLFSIDPESGRLADTGQALDAPTPASVSFVN